VLSFLKRLFSGSSRSNKFRIRIEGEQVGDRIYLFRRESGKVDGRHYTDYVEDVKELKRQGRIQEAEDLLLRLINAVEAEAKEMNWGVAPWYYEQLAIIYRKQKRYEDEVAILERYEKQIKAPGVGPSNLAQRLEKAKAFLLKPGAVER